ncbi:hypothetical protein [Mucilaginibacter flavidus]|uniref:hypothetical protein n=1 Tax=Mucilaginibacter flavidus TaxID=2949309 RepID=UPI002092332F|nr:hypothetical protein [Mucilaginibacter flavidus]MCO5945658.1 hypothetical protein [Mucilaginibacter flavidus]
MKNLKAAIFTIFLIMPLMLFAHGEEVIFTLFIQIIAIIIFLIVLIFIKLNSKQKAILAGVYFLAVVLVFFATSTIPYRVNMTGINLSITLIPATCAVLSYILLKLNSPKD